MDKKKDSSEKKEIKEEIKEEKKEVRIFRSDNLDKNMVLRPGDIVIDAIPGG